MTILNNFLVFNKTVEMIKCSSCDGAGKVKCTNCDGAGKRKSDAVSKGTLYFCIAAGTVGLMSFIDMIGSTPNYFISAPVFVVSTAIGIMILVEHKQQTMSTKGGVKNK